MDKLLGLEFWMWEPEDHMTRGNDVAIPGDKLAPSELSVSTQLWWVKHLHFFHSFIIFCKHNATANDSTVYLSTWSAPQCYPSNLTPSHE